LGRQGGVGGDRELGPPLEPRRLLPRVVRRVDREGLGPVWQVGAVAPNVAGEDPGQGRGVTIGPALPPLRLARCGFIG